MLSHVREPGRIGYTNLRIIASSLAAGAVLILSGLLVGRLRLPGFRLCFLASGIGGMLAAVALFLPTP